MPSERGTTFVAVRGWSRSNSTVKESRGAALSDASEA
jgi:hypothetical protein